MLGGRISTTSKNTNVVDCTFETVINNRFIKYLGEDFGRVMDPNYYRRSFFSKFTVSFTKVKKNLV